MNTIQAVNHEPSDAGQCTAPVCDAFVTEELPTSADGLMDSDSAGSNGILSETPVDTMVETPGECSHEHTAMRRVSQKPREPFSIRFVPVLDHSSTTSVRCFKPIERRLTKEGVFRVGRVDSRNNEHPDLVPIIFRSKVVSRFHAEISFKDGQWYVKDIQSSSGTFLNNSRLAPANKPSPDCLLSNGDVLQFGINFRGGHEEAFQCIKVRVELNYSWHHKVSDYNIQSLKKVRQEMSKFGDGALLECTICLTSVRPGQPLFISACTHGWHYRCIRPLLVRTYPQFQCPNCRAIYDLEEDEEDEDNEDDTSGDDFLDTF